MWLMHDLIILVNGVIYNMYTLLICVLKFYIML